MFSTKAHYCAIILVMVMNDSETTKQEEILSADDAPVSEDNSALDDSSISIEEFAELLENLDERDLRFMLAAAGEKPNEILGDVSDEKTDRKKKKKKKGKKRKWIWAAAIALEALVILVAANILYNSVTVNSDDNLFHSATTTADKISYSDGILKVNNVSVKVPTKVDEKYDISYAWDEKDSEYPTIPRSVTVSYADKNKEPKYNISLYRQDTIEKKDIPQGKDESNWFSDWAASDDNDTTQKVLKSGDIHGFYISPAAPSTKNGDDSSYDSYTYYFAVKDDSGIKIYVFEGVCEDDQYSKELSAAMKKSIESIKIEKPKKKTVENESTEQA